MSKHKLLANQGMCVCMHTHKKYVINFGKITLKFPSSQPMPSKGL